MWHIDLLVQIYGADNKIYSINQFTATAAGTTGADEWAKLAADNNN